MAGKPHGGSHDISWETDVREWMIGYTDLAFQTAQALMIALPLACLPGIAVQLWPRRFGALGTSAVRKGLAAIMWIVCLFAVTGFLLLYYVSQHYDRSYGYGFIPFAVYVGPSLLLSLIGLIIRYKARAGAIDGD